MIIIHVITAFGIGGAEKLLLNIVNKQVEQHEVHLIYLKPINDLIHLLDKKVITKQISLSLLTVNKLKNYFNSTKADVIHTHLGHADLLGIYAAKNTSSKIFTTIHSTFFKKTKIDSIFFFLYKVLLHKVKKTQVIVISKAVENLVKNTFRVSESRIHLLYNAIPNKEYSQNIKKKQSIIKLLFIGRLSKAKSIDTLLKSVSLLKNKNIELTIVGDGILKNELQLLSETLKIDPLVKFVGVQENVVNYYNEADVFILPSIWEGFGIVILEAFRSKLVVISSNIEGPAELIEHNKNGLLFEPKNYYELSKKLDLLIENKELRESLAKSGFETFTEKFHINLYIKKLNQLYIDA